MQNFKSRYWYLLYW